MKVPEERVSAATLEALKFEELAMPLFDQLYNFARWLTQDTAEAEDLVQETYTKALRGFSSFQLGTNFRAWMYRILRNSFLSSRTGLQTMVAIDGEADENFAGREYESGEHPDRASGSRDGAAGTGRLARALSRNFAACVRSRRCRTRRFRRRWPFLSARLCRGCFVRARRCAIWCGRRLRGAGMACERWGNKEYAGELSAYLDGELDPAEAAALGAHLRECAACAADALGRVQMKRSVQMAGKRYSAEPGVPESDRKGNEHFLENESKKRLALADSGRACSASADAFLWR